MNSIAVIYLGRKGAGPVFAYEMTKGLIENGVNVYAFISENVENLEKWKLLHTMSTEIIPTADNTLGFVKGVLYFRAFIYRKLKTKYSHIKVDACYIPMGHVWDDYIINLLNNPYTIKTIHDPIPHSSDRSLKNIMIRIASSLLNTGIHKKKPDTIIVLSKKFQEYAAKRYNIPIGNVKVIPHGIFDFYQTVDNGEVFDYPKGKINFLFWGRITSYKGLDILAEAYSKLKQSESNITLTVVGSGDFSPYKDAYSALKDVTVINRWIKDEEVASFFKTKEKIILVLPYRDATQSGVIPTAMSFSVPVMVSNTGGLSEQVEDGVTGYLFEPNSVDSLIMCMKKLISTDTTEITKNALAYVKSLDWVSLSKEVISII